MSEILGDYAGYIARVEQTIEARGIDAGELVQCDMVNYECSTNERYEEVKAALLQSAKLLSEIQHGGRLVSIYQNESPLIAGRWQVPYVELLQPKPTRENHDGIDGVFFVTSVALPAFLKSHASVDFETKGLANKANPYVELKADGVAVKFHDRHMGAVLEIEHMMLSNRTID